MATVLGWGGMPFGLPGRFAVLLLSSTSLSTGGAATGGGTTPAASGPLDITTRFLIGETRTGVPFQYVESFGPGEVPAGTYIYGTLDSGASVLVQSSSEARWPDGSLKTAKLTGTIPGPRAKGATVPVRLRTSQGTQDTTPCISLADIAARSDFRIRCYGHDFGAEEYELRLNDLIAANTPGWTTAQSGTNYPTAGIEMFGAGQECVDFVAWCYARRTTDKAVHKTYKLRLYVTYLKGADGFQLLPEWEQPNAYDGLPDSVATAGPAKPQRIAGIVELYNGTALLHACGGPNDWRAVTVDGSAFDPATNMLTYPTGARMGFASTAPNFGANGVSWGFAPTAGASLPPGVSALECYHPGRFTASGNGKGPLWRFRGITATIAAQPAPAAYDTTKASYTVGTTVNSGGAYYICRTAGTPGTAGPSGVGSAISVPGGTSVWENIAAVFGGTGSGTIRMYPLAHSYMGGGGTGWTREMRRAWVGSGPQPWCQVGLDFAHAFRKTRMLPPMDYEAAASAPAPAGTPMDFELHMVSSVNIWNIEATGDTATEDRIGPMVWSQARMLLQWDNAVSWRRGLGFGGSMGDFQFRWCDERSGQFIVPTRGPNRDGVTYPGHAPCNNSLWISNKASTTGDASWNLGNPAFAKGFPKFSGTYARDDSGYSYAYYDMGGAAHMPNGWQVPYILTGDAAWIRMGMGMLNANVCQSWRGATISPNQNTALGAFAPAIVGQPRGVAWTLREATNLEMLAPDSHPNKPIIRDILQQNCKFYRVNAESNLVNHLGLPTYSANATSDVGGRPYHHGFLYYIFSLMDWRYQGTDWGADLGVILNCYDKYFVDMYDETQFPGALYFHCEYGVSQINNVGAFDVHDVKNVLGRGPQSIAQSFAEVWKINYGDPPATEPTTPLIAGKNIVAYRRTSMAGLDGTLPVQYQVSTGCLGMRGVRQPRTRAVRDAVNARVGNTSAPLTAGSDLVAHWSALPLDT